MRSWVCLVVALGTCVTGARADGPWLLFNNGNWAFPKLRDEWRQRGCWCPDDYRCKPLPNVPTNPRGCADDYCRKTPPVVPPNARGCVDDYCPTRCPLFLGKLCEPWYTCGPRADTRAEPCRGCKSSP
jgi:hypothetical protein